MQDSLDPKQRFLDEEIERRLNANPAAAPDRPLPRGLTRAPLAPAQIGFWLSYQFDPGNPSANRPVVLSLEGPLDEACLWLAVNHIVECQQALRTVFESGLDEPVQIVRPFTPAPARREDFSALAPEAQDREVQSALRAEAHRCFDLARGPLLRALLLRLNPHKHILGLFTHHIVFDGWSERILVRELKQTYSALKENRPPALPELPLQYADFASWHAERLASGLLDRQLQYWRAELFDPPTPALPKPPSPSDQRPGTAKHCVLPLTPELSSQVLEFSRRERLTAFMTLFAAFQLLLARYGDTGDVLTGVPTAARTHIETEPLIGCFLNILPMRTRLRPEMTGQQLLLEIRRSVLSGFANQEVPFTVMLEPLRTAEAVRRGRVLQTLFQLRNLPDTGPEQAAGLRFTTYPFETELLEGTDLSLEIRRRNGQLECLLRYLPGGVDLPSPTSFLEHYRNLLSDLIRQPGESIWTLPMLSASERQRILFSWNAARADYPKDVCIHELYERQADLKPSAPAAVCGAQTMTYAELERRSNQIAHALIRRGAGPDQRVVLCVEKTNPALAAMVGILKSGAAYVPIDPSLPQERVHLLVNDVEPAAVIVDQTSELLFSSLSVPKLRLDPEWTAVAGENEARPRCGVRPENLAYILFTSGSTGMPKGVAVEHRHVVCFLHSFRPLPPDASPRRGTCLSPLNFDLSVEEIFACLCFGGTVHLLRPREFLDPAWLAHYLIKQRISICYLYPDLLEPVAAELSRLGGPVSLRTLITGIQSVKFRSLLPWRELSPQLRILNDYGPTEITFGATAYEFLQAQNPEANVPIGKPFPNYAVYILDSHLQPVPPGVKGEIYVGGPCVARGYWRRPEETARAFLPDPFGAQPGGRLYKTGDLGRYLPDGNIEFLGRADFQVKIRGYRIELEEIEAALRSHPGVAEAIVALWEPAPGDNALAAYVVPRKDASLDPPALRDFLTGRLPAYMIPTDWVLLDQLPRTTSRKLDRSNLPRPVRTPPAKAHPDQTVLDRIQAKLIAIWRDLLGTEDIGPDDHFFDLGGHSLLAVRMFAEIEKQFGLRLAPGSIFEAPTVRQLSERLRKPSAGPESGFLVRLRMTGSRRPLFMPHGHEGSVFLYRALVSHLSPEQPVYGLHSAAVSFEGSAAPSLKTVAADFTREIRSVQPHGPYSLAGFCTGAYLAFETACQLQAQGESIAILAIINTPGDWRHVSSWEDSLRYHAAVLRSLSPSEIPTYILQRLHYRWNRIFDASLHTLSRLGVLPAPDRAPRRLRVRLLRDAYIRASRRYRPQRKFRGRLIYIQGSGDTVRDHLLYWAPLIDGEILTLPMPGRGPDVLREPNAALLAKILDRLLSETA